MKMDAIFNNFSGFAQSRTRMPTAAAGRVSNPGEIFPESGGVMFPASTPNADFEVGAGLESVIPFLAPHSEFRACRNPHSFLDFHDLWQIFCDNWTTMLLPAFKS